MMEEEEEKGEEEKNVDKIVQAAGKRKKRGVGGRASGYKKK